MRITWLATIGIVVLTANTTNAQNVHMGTRYQLIDREVESVTTGFRDAEVTSVRTAQGKIETRLRTRDGVSTTTVAPQQVRLIATRTGSAPREIYVDAQSLDAINAERYIAWKSSHGPKRIVELPLRMNETEAPAELREAADAVVWVKTRSGRLEAYSRAGSPRFVEGRELPAFTSVIRQDGEMLGGLAWYQIAQTLVFQTKWQREPLQFRGEDLPKGWAFRPNMAWANIQLLSFAKSAEERGLTAPAQNGRIRSLDTDGCDGLHWLDGSIFRQCCDVHDWCYRKDDPVCGWSSWWFQGSWSCVQCNIEALVCFAASAVRCSAYGCTLYQAFPNYPPPNNCYASYGDFCPAWCGCCDDGTAFGCP